MSAEDFAVSVMKESASPKRQAREAIQARAIAYVTAVERTAAGHVPTAEEAAILAAGPVSASDEDLRRMDLQIEDAVAVRLTKEAIAERDKKRDEIKTQIDRLRADNVAAWEEVAAVDKKHAPAVAEARAVIAAWERDIKAVATKIKGQEEQAKELAAQWERVPYVDHTSQLVVRRQSLRERSQQSSLRVEASGYKTEAETKGPQTFREVAAIVAPQVTEDVGHAAIGLRP
jgi:hypothetical protein